MQLDNLYSTDIDFNTEADYIQENVNDRTDFDSGEVKLHGSGISVTGGSISTIGSDTIHRFTGSSTFSVTGSGNARVLVVGGGGSVGGGVFDKSYHAGGGGGRVLYSSSYAISGNMSVTVGGGGAALHRNEGTSVFGSIVASPGRYGYNVNSISHGGASGSGRAGGTWTSPYAAPGGGNSHTGYPNSGNTPGVGGAGTSNSISGTSVSYGGGGKGGTTDSRSYNGASGTSRGGGGTTGNGGSGVVIIYYTSTLAYPTTTYNTTTWTNGITTGLGFSVISFPEALLDNNDFENTWVDGTCGQSTNQYAGIPDTAQAISAVTSYQETSTSTDICYKVDVSPSQQSGVYTGQVTYTATTDASSYHK